MLYQAMCRISYNQSFLLSNMDGERLAFKDETFDKVYISGSLRHFHSHEAGIRELIRVLKRNGRFCIMEPNYLFPTNYYAAHVKLEEHNIRLITKKNLRLWLKRADVDFVADNFAYTPPFPKMLLPLFDRIDNILECCPGLNRFSIMLLARGVKRSGI